MAQGAGSARIFAVGMLLFSVLQCALTVEGATYVVGGGQGWNSKIQSSGWSVGELRMLAVHRCPLRELPFGKVEGEKGLLGLKDMQLNDTKICEVSFPEGVCPGLQNLSITFCKILLSLLREVRTERTPVGRMGKSQNHCSRHSPSYLQRDMNFTASTNWKASINSEESIVGSGQNACPLHSSMLRQMPMNMNSNSTPVNQNHCERRGDAEGFQMGGSQSQNHPQLRYSTIGQLPVKTNKTSIQAPVEPVNLRANNSSLSIVRTGYGGEISAGAKERGGNPVGLVTVNIECGSESTDGASEGKGNSARLVRVKKEHGSEITAGDEEEKGNYVGLLTVKQEYGSEFTTWANEGRGNFVGLAEAASLNVNATTNV